MERAWFYDWREWRRFRAVDLDRLRWVHRDIAAALGVSEAAVSQWLACARQEGTNGLLAHPHGGHPKLTPQQQRLLPDFLWHGAEAYGFRGELWTCARIVKMLRWEFGVSFHKDHVSRMLKAMGWTPQIPITRAIQRNEAEIERWRTEVWPKLRRRAHRERRTLIFTDESGFYLLPAVLRTYGPKGETPVLPHRAGRDHLSVMGGVTVEGKVYTLVRHKTLNEWHTIRFLQHLRVQAGKPLLVVWDGSPIHRSGEVQGFLTGIGVKEITVARLPGYAPDLNPVEWLWKQLKYVELPNKACMDLEELHLEFHLAIGRVRQRPALIDSFFEGAGLPIIKT
jgi:transposase